MSRTCRAPDANGDSAIGGDKHVDPSMRRAGSNDVPIIGVAEWFFETGFEGVRWTVSTDYGASRRSNENVYFLRDGDQLTIYDTDGGILFDGIVDLDFQVNWRPYPQNPGDGQQAIGPCWVHGVQRGVTPDLWADWFWGHEIALPTIRQTLRSRPYTAKLIRASR